MKQFIIAIFKLVKRIYTWTSSCPLCKRFHSLSSDSEQNSKSLDKPEDK